MQVMPDLWEEPVIWELDADEAAHTRGVNSRHHFVPRKFDERGDEDPSVSLAEEVGTIEFRKDKSITVAGHRVRLSRVFEFVTSEQRTLEDLSRRFPTIERPLMAKVISYIARRYMAVRQHAKEEERLSSLHLANATRISLDDLRARKMDNG